MFTKFAEKEYIGQTIIEKAKIVKLKYKAQKATEALREIIKIYQALNDDCSNNSMANELGLTSGFYNGKGYSNKNFLSWIIFSHIDNFNIKKKEKTLTNKTLYEMAQKELEKLLRAIMDLLFIYPCGNTDMSKNLGIYMHDSNGGNGAFYSWSALSILDYQGLIDIYDKDDNKMIFSERKERQQMKKFKISENIDIHDYIITKQESIKKTDKKVWAGKLRISKILKKQNIVFSREKTFSDLKGVGNRCLRFDFCCIIDDKILLIEHDGEQHFKSVKYYGGDVSFERCQKYDKMKNDYCKKNNIKLLRISFEEVLEKNIEKYILEYIDDTNILTFKGSAYNS
jgi:hypothetical protein